MNVEKKNKNDNCESKPFVQAVMLTTWLMEQKEGRAENRTRIIGFKVQCDNHYTTQPAVVRGMK